jgi:hypothetical protein
VVARKARCGEQGGAGASDGGGCQVGDKSSKEKRYGPVEAEDAVNDGTRLNSRHGARLSGGRELVAPASRGRRTGASVFGRARNKVLTLHAIPNIYFSYELRRSGEADAGRAYDAALLHHRLHFLGVQPSTGLRYVGDVLKDDHVIREARKIRGNSSRHTGHLL